MEIRSVAVGQLGANCYLAIDETTRAAAIIDPGDDVPQIIEMIRAAGADLRHILLTHGHPDHSFAAGELQKLFPGVKLAMHEADLSQLEGEPELVVLFFDPADHVEPELGPFLYDGQTIELGETRLKCIHTPGHSPGGMCYLSGSDCFTGDTLFNGSIGRTDFPGGDMDTLMRSIHGKLLTLPDDTLIHPGHGAPSTIGRERRMNPWLG